MNPHSTIPALPKKTRDERQGRVRMKEEHRLPARPLKAINRSEKILRELDRYRFLNNQQVADLLFVDTLNSHNRMFTPDGAKDAADRSLRLLFESGYIERHMVYQPSRKPKSMEIVRSPINILTTKGLRVVKKIMEEEADPRYSVRWTRKLRHFKDQSISHIVEINDAGIALRRAIGAEEAMEFLVWFDDDQLSRMRNFTNLKSLIPDGFCIVQVITDSGARLIPLFLEVDRQTESIRSEGVAARDWQSKIIRYGEYFQFDFFNDPLLDFVGCGPQEREMLDSPRVLTITKSEKRVERMIDVTAEVGGKGTYLYTTKGQAFEEGRGILGEIWRTTTVPRPQTTSLRSLLKR